MYAMQKAARVLKFGPFRIDTQAKLLFCKDERLALPPKAADLLGVLLEREGPFVSKDDLLSLIWPDTFVEESNLSKNIFLLRKTLGDTEDGAAYIETIPKRGY